MRVSIRFSGVAGDLPAKSDVGRGKIAAILEDHAISFESAVAVQASPCPEVDLEETEDALAVAGHQLGAGRLEVAGPRLQGQVVAVAVVMQGDRLQRGARGRGEELGQYDGRVIPGK